MHAGVSLIAGLNSPLERGTTCLVPRLSLLAIFKHCSHKASDSFLGIGCGQPVLICSGIVSQSIGFGWVPGGH